MNDSRRVKLLTLSEAAPERAPQVAPGADLEVIPPGAAVEPPPSAEYDGWILNLSRGGVRLILEETVRVGQPVMVHIGEEGEADAVRRPARIVWVMQEPDGVIAGLEFSDGRTGGSSPSIAAVVPPSAASVVPAETAVEPDPGGGIDAAPRKPHA